MPPYLSSEPAALERLGTALTEAMRAVRMGEPDVGEGIDGGMLLLDMFGLD